MDPQAIWNELQEAIQRHDAETTHDCARSLLNWLARGGFAPMTSDDPTMNADAHRQAALDCCRTVLRRTADA